MHAPPVVLVPAASATAAAVDDPPPPSRLDGHAAARDADGVQAPAGDEDIAPSSAWNAGPHGGVICGRAVACCRKVISAHGQGAQPALCDSFAKLPDATCAQLLNAFRVSAQGVGASCY